MISDTGTDGIAHTIHVATENDNDDLSNFRKFENVVDAMNLPDGTVKFYFEGAEKHIENGRIVRSTVQGIEDAYRYRCGDCLIEQTDVITQTDHGEKLRLECPVCEMKTPHERMAVKEP